MLGVIELLRFYFHFGSNQGVASVTVGTVVRSCIAEDSQVQLTPVFLPGMSPRHFMACLVRCSDWFGHYITEMEPVIIAKGNALIDYKRDLASPELT